jgi:hypothetical protein
MAPGDSSGCAATLSANAARDLSPRLRQQASAHCGVRSSTRQRRLAARTLPPSCRSAQGLKPSLVFSLAVLQQAPGQARSSQITISRYASVERNTYRELHNERKRKRRRRRQVSYLQSFPIHSQRLKPAFSRSVFQIRLPGDRQKNFLQGRQTELQVRDAKLRLPVFQQLEKALKTDHQRPL